MKKLRALVALGLVATLVTGCGSSGKDSSSDVKVPVLASDADATRFDPTTTNDATSLQMINAQSEGLYRLDENGKPVEGMAEKVEKSDDGLVYTFHLRDTKWANGEPVTANDFVFSFKRLFDANVAKGVNNRFFALKGLLGVKGADEIAAGLEKPTNPQVPVSELGVKAIDDKTFELTLQDPCPIIGELLAYPCFFPLNEKFVTAAGAEFGTSPEKTLGCGPYVLKDWQASNSITFDKNKDYYAADEVKVDGMKFIIKTDATARAISYDSGEVMFAKISGELADQYKDKDGYTTFLEAYLAYLSLNQAVAGLENVNLRKAIGLSIDKDALVNNVLKDGSEVADFIIPKGLANGPDGKDFRESVGKDVKYLATDKEKAKEYYEKAKKELGKDTFEFSVMVGETDTNKKVAEFYQSELSKNLPGFKLNINVQPSKTFYDKASAKEFDILSIMWGPDYAYPTTYTNLWKTGDANNYSNYSSAAYDKLQEATTTGALLADEQKRWDGLKEMEKILLEDDAAVIPQFQRGWVGLIDPSLKGIAYRSSGVKFDYRGMYIEK